MGPAVGFLTGCRAGTQNCGAQWPLRIPALLFALLGFVLLNFEVGDGVCNDFVWMKRKFQCSFAFLLSSKYAGAKNAPSPDAPGLWSLWPPGG